MKYEFNLEDYDDILDDINERKDVDDYGFKQIKIAENNNSELYVYGYRVVIPELDVTVREGVEYYQDDDEDEEEPVESIVLYTGDEKNPMKFKESYSNTFLTSVVSMIAHSKGLNTNPKCFIDDCEFELEKE